MIEYEGAIPRSINTKPMEDRESRAESELCYLGSRAGAGAGAETESCGNGFFFPPSITLPRLTYFNPISRSHSATNGKGRSDRSRKEGMDSEWIYCRLRIKGKLSRIIYMFLAGSAVRVVL